MITLLAAEGPHISLKAEALFTVGPLTVTNSMVYGVVIAVLISALLIRAGRRSSLRPRGGIIQFVELGLEFLIDALTPILGSRGKADKYTPYFATFFFFIVCNNLAGLVPVVGEGITIGATPVFRPFTADLNGTLALSIVSIVLVQIFSIRESGLMGHFEHYFTDKPYNPINFFIGILEVFGEITRVISLALRLFLNTAVGEILIALFAFIGAYGATFTLLPIVSFEIMVAFIQAYVFTLLSAIYLGLAISHGHKEHAPKPAHQTVTAVSPSEVRV